MTAEAALRWAMTAVAVGALVVLAVVLGASLSPALAAGVVLVVSGVLAVVLWRRQLERAQHDRELATIDEKQRRNAAALAAGPPPVDNGRY